MIIDAWQKKRTLRKLAQIVEKTQLNLSGLNLYTEAATGNYNISAALGVLAGARAVHCVARSNRFGSAQLAISQTNELVESVQNVNGTQVTYSEGHDYMALAEADIITNSNPLRPLDEVAIKAMKKGGVISLMYEPWEYRQGDIDLEAAQEKNVWIVGVNEMHPTIPCFYSAGILPLKGMLMAGLEVFSSDVLLVCANRLIDYALPVLSKTCASVHFVDGNAFQGEIPPGCKRIQPYEVNNTHYDALLLFDSPDTVKWNVANTADTLWPIQSLGHWDVCVQMMGDVLRSDFEDVKFVPEKEPPRGYMGFNPADLGVDLVIRTVVSGLKAGQEAIAFLQNGNTKTDAEKVSFEWIKSFYNRA